MIYTSGVVSFLAKKGDSKPLSNYKSKTISLELIEENFPDDSRDSVGKIRCKFIAILPRSYDCKTLEDYTGKIKPFLQKSTGNVIMSVEISHLNYMSNQAMNRVKKN